MPNERATDIEDRLVEEIIDHGTGKGTKTTYDPETGEALLVEEVDRPLPEPVVLTPEEQIASLQAQVNELTAIIAGE